MEGIMKSYWKKKLSAFLLALTLIVGLMPTALAADCGHNNWSTWQKLNDQQHQRTCLTSGCDNIQTANSGPPFMKKTPPPTGRNARNAAPRPPIMPIRTAAA